MQKNIPRALYITTYAPVGTSTGHQKANSAFLNFLKNFLLVDVISVRPLNDTFNINEKITNGEFYSIRKIHHKFINKLFNIFIGLFLGASFQESLNQNKSLISAIKKLQQNNYDVAFVETYWLYEALRKIMPNLKIILLAHSAESIYLESRLKKFNLPRSMINFLLSRVRAVEKDLLKKGMILSMGSVPLSLLSKSHNIKINSLFFPNILEPGPSIKVNQTKISKIICLIGNFYYYPNVAGLKFFSQKYLPKIMQLGWNVMVIGKISEDLSNIVKKCSSYNKNLKILGFVDSINEYLINCTCMFCPPSEFSGDLIKVWTAIENGKIIAIPRNYYESNKELEFFSSLIVDYDESDDFSKIENKIIQKLNNIDLSKEFNTAFGTYNDFLHLQKKYLKSYILNLCLLRECHSESASSGAV